MLTPGGCGTIGSSGQRRASRGQRPSHRDRMRSWAPAVTDSLSVPPLRRGHGGSTRVRCILPIHSRIGRAADPDSGLTGSSDGNNGLRTPCPSGTVHQDSSFGGGSGVRGGDRQEPPASFLRRAANRHNWSGDRRPHVWKNRHPPNNRYSFTSEGADTYPQVRPSAPGFPTRQDVTALRSGAYGPVRPFSSRECGLS